MNRKSCIWLFLILSIISTCAVWSAPAARIDLAGQWKFSVDPDNTGIQKGWQTANFNAGSWRLINVPATWESQGITQPNPQWTQDTMNTPYSGYAWYRKTVTIPADWNNRKIFLNAGKIDDQDSTFVNGVLVGETTLTDASSKYRSYEIPAGVLRVGQSNILSIRVLNLAGNGGIVAGPVTMTLGEPDTAPSATPAPIPSVPIAPSSPPEDSVNVGSDTVVGPGQTVSDAVAVRGNVIINGGHVTGDAVAVLGDVRVTDNGRVDGDAVSVMGHVVKDSGGTIGGQETSVGMGGVRGGHRAAPKPDGGLFVAGLGALILMALLATAITALFPARIETVASTVLTKTGMSVLYGIAGLLLIVPIAVILFFTCIGIPLIIVEIVFAVVVWIFGIVAIDLIVGRKVSNAVNRPIANAVLAAAVGSVILSLINLIPFLGGLLVFALALIGFGAVLMSGFGANPDWMPNRFGGSTSSPVAPEPPAAPEPPVPPTPPVAPGPPAAPEPPESV